MRSAPSSARRQSVPRPIEVEIQGGDRRRRTSRPDPAPKDNGEPVGLWPGGARAAREARQYRREPALSGHGTTGAEKELQQELELDADQVPLSLLNVEGRQVEHRTAGQTPAPTDTRRVPACRSFPSVFPMAAAATFLGVEMPTGPGR